MTYTGQIQPRFFIAKMRQEQTGEIKRGRAPQRGRRNAAAANDQRQGERNRAQFAGKLDAIRATAATLRTMNADPIGTGCGVWEGTPGRRTGDPIRTSADLHTDEF